MTTETDIPELPEPVPGGSVGVPQLDSRPDDTTATAGPSQPRDEATVRGWEGLAPDTVILAPAFSPPPMRCPHEVWAMLMTAVDIVGDADPDHAGEVALFAGSWVLKQPPADSLYDGDLVVRLTYPAEPTYALPRNRAVDVEMLLAYRGHWQRVGQWRGIDDGWPVMAPTAAAVMGLHGDATEAAIWSETPPPSTSPPLIKWARGGIAELLDAGLVTAGEELVWNRRNLGVRHTARVRVDGTLIIADGRVFANPCGATTALGGNHQNGWTAFRASDGRTLGDLRAELRARREQ